MANFYYIGSGTSGTPTGWNNSNYWATTSSGTPGAGIPGVSDTAIFDAGSKYCTLDTAMNISALTLGSGYVSTLSLGSYSSTVSGTVAHIQGTLNTNSQTWTWGYYTSSSSTSTRTLTLGSSSGTFNNPVSGYGYSSTSNTGLTVTSNTATITFSGVVIGAAGMNTAGWFGTSLIFQGTSTTNISNCTVANITYAPISGNTNTFSIGPNITASGLTFIGSSAPNAILVQSNAVGTISTIICSGTVTISGQVDFQEITGAGTASWNFSSGLAGDCGGNSGITFPTAQNNYYYATGNGNYSTLGNWYLATGGTGGAGRIPLPQDTAIFNSSSGSITATFDTPRIGSMISAGFTGTSTLGISKVYCFGNVSLGGTYTSTSNIFNPVGIGSFTWTNNGVSMTWTVGVGSSYTTSAYTLTLQDSLNISPNYRFLYLRNGTFNANNFNVTTGQILNDYGSPIINFGSGTWNCTGILFQIVSSSTTVNANTSTILMSDNAATTFNGLGKTFNNLIFSGGSSQIVTVSGSNTFTSISGINLNTLTLSSGTTTTVTSGLSIQGTAGNLVTVNSTVSGGTAVLAVNTPSISTFNNIQDIMISGTNPHVIAGSVTLTNTSGWTSAYVPVTGGGNWSATTTWSGSVVPTSSNYVVFLSTSGPVTIDTSAAACNSLASIGYTNTLTHTAGIVCNIGSTTYFSPALQLNSTMTYTAGSTASQFNFLSTGSGIQTITHAGKSLGYITISGGTNATYQLQDAEVVTSGVNHYIGTLNTNNQSCNWYSYNSPYSNTRTLTMGSSNIAISWSGGWNTSGFSNYTVTANTATILFSGTQGGNGVTTGQLNFNGTSIIISGTGTLNWRTGGASIGATMQNFSYLPPLGTSNILQFGTAVFINGNFTISGAAAPNRVLVSSSTVGTSETISVSGTVYASYCDFQDIIGSGTASWNLANITGGAGNALGCSGITFTTAQTNYYFSTTSGNYSNASNWYLATSGTGGAGRVPLPQDTGYFDINSGPYTCTMDNARFGSWLATGFTGTFICGSSVPSPGPTCFGNIALGGTYTQTSSQLSLGGRGLQTWTNNGVAFPWNVTSVAFSGTYTLQDAINMTGGPTGAGYLRWNYGTFTTNNYNINCTQLDCNTSQVKTLNFGSSTITVNGTGNPWSWSATGTTLNPGTSTIILAANGAVTFPGAGLTYSNLIFSGGSSQVINVTGNNTFTSISGINLNTLTLSSGSITTVTSGLSLNGSDKNYITINSTVSGTPATIVSTNPVSCSWLQLQDTTASGSTPFQVTNGLKLNTDVTNWLITNNRSVSPTLVGNNPFSGRNPVYTTYDSTISGLAPVAWWKLNDPNGSTTVNDSSGKGYNASVSGSLSLGQVGPIGSGTAALFDGSTTFITTPLLLSGTVSVIAWYKTIVSGRQILDTRATNSTTNGWYIYVNSAKLLSFGNYNAVSSGYITVDTQSTTDNNWHMGVGVYNQVAQTSTLYRDGILVASGSDIYGNGNPTYARIGSAAYTITAQFNGDIAEIAVFSGALTSTQVSNLYNLGSSWYTNYQRNKNVNSVKINIQKTKKQSNKNINSVLVGSVKVIKQSIKNVRSLVINTTKIKKQSNKNINSVEIGTIRPIKKLSRSLKTTEISTLRPVKKLSRTLQSTEVNAIRPIKTLSRKLKSVLVDSAKTIKQSIKNVRSLTINIQKTKKQSNKNINPTQIVSATITRKIARRRGITATITYTIGNSKKHTYYRQIKATVINALKVQKAKTHHKTATAVNVNSSMSGEIKIWHFVIQFVTKIASFNRQIFTRTNFGQPNPDPQDPNMNEDLNNGSPN